MKIIGQLFKYSTLLILATTELLFEVILNLVKAIKQAIDKK